MLRDLCRAHGAARFDQNTQKPFSVRKLSDHVRGSRIDTRINEARQKSVVTDDPDRRVSRPKDLPRDFCDAPEDRIDVQL